MELDSIFTSADASIIALYILTSKNMSNQIYLDDTIDIILTFTSKHLQHTIYPACNKNKDLVDLVTYFFIN